MKKEESITIQVGNTSFIKANLAGILKEDFKKTYKGKLSIDINEE